MRFKVEIKSGCRAVIHTSEMIIPAKELSYHRNEEDHELPCGILALMSRVPAINSVDVHPYDIEVSLDRAMEEFFILATVEDVLEKLEPKFNLECQPMDDEMSKRFFLPFRMGKEEEFIFLDDCFDMEDIALQFLMIDGVSGIRPNNTTVEIRKGHFADWDEIIEQIEKIVRRSLRFEKYIYG